VDHTSFVIKIGDLHEILVLMIESLKIIVQFYISIPKNSMYLELGTTAQNKTFYFFIQNLSDGFNLSKEPNHSIDKREISLGFYCILKSKRHLKRFLK
jgi:hypothetical protein